MVSGNLKSSRFIWKNGWMREVTQSPNSSCIVLELSQYSVYVWTRVYHVAQKIAASAARINTSNISVWRTIDRFIFVSVLSYDTDIWESVVGLRKAQTHFYKVRLLVLASHTPRSFSLSSNSMSIQFDPLYYSLIAVLWSSHPMNPISAFHPAH